ncbi:Uncharacterised protein [Bordetella pertussis]|nr:Uncharacterised protein [Bordetella pertussis]
MPCACSFSLTSGIFSTAPTSAWILATTASGVPAGASRPIQAAIS